MCLYFIVVTNKMSQNREKSPKLINKVQSTMIVNIMQWGKRPVQSSYLFTVFLLLLFGLFVAIVFFLILKETKRIKTRNVKTHQQ